MEQPLDLIGGRVRMYAEVQRIQRFRYAFDGAAFAAGIPSFKGQDCGNAFVKRFYLQFPEPFLIFVQLLLIFVLGNILA